MTFADADLTEDALLGGRVRLRQPRGGNRVTMDAVLLAAAVGSSTGERVLDVGCGAGAVALCVGERTGARVEGLEILPDYAALAKANGLARVWNEDLLAPGALKGESFDWVVTNPPYFDPAAPASQDAGRAVGRQSRASAGAWMAAALKRVRSGGGIACVHLVEKLPELLAGLDGAGDIAVLPLAARAGRAPKRMILTARKGTRAPFRLAPPLTIHAGARHERDADDYTDQVKAILQDAASLSF
ncbi:MAG: methyltransferase [Pseudomonadota bacterium]